MKIIRTDNFGRDYMPEFLVAEKVPAYYAKLILNFLLQAHTSDNGPDYYKLEKDDYKLYQFEP